MGNKSYSKGISWINDCRIPFVDDGDKSIGIITKEKQNIFGNGGGFIRGEYEINNQGRFPANILVCDDMLNDGVISKAGEYKGDGSKSGGIWTKSTGKPAGLEYGDKGSNSRYYDIDKWFNNLIE